MPTGQPSRIPSGQPSEQPSTQPTGQPTIVPSGEPSGQPTSQPTSQPTAAIVYKTKRELAMEHTNRVQRNLNAQERKAGIYARGPPGGIKISTGPAMGSVDEAIALSTNIVENNQHQSKNRVQKTNKKKHNEF